MDDDLDSDETDVDPTHKIGKQGSADYTDSYPTQDCTPPIG